MSLLAGAGGVFQKVGDFMKSPASRIVVVAAVIASYGVGYWKGARASTSKQATIQKQVETESKKTEEIKSRTIANIYGNEEILETRLTLPEMRLPDGSVKSQVRITREVAQKQDVQSSSTSTSEVKVVEKIVEKRVEVPGPPGRCPDPFVPEARRRFMAGPAFGRDLDLGEYIVGGSAAVRLGRFWIRAAADTRPALIGSLEIEF